MTRAEFVERLILDSMCDDYENVDQVILRDVAETAARCGLKIERSEVVERLRSLVAAGLAKAYDLSVDPSRELEGMPPLEAIEWGRGVVEHPAVSTLVILGASIVIYSGIRLIGR